MRSLRRVLKLGIGVGGLVCAGLLISGCQTTEPPYVWSGESSANSVALKSLRIGDLLQVTFSDLVTPQPPFEGRIKEDGTITLLLNQTFTAAGKTFAELEKEIRERYVPKLFVNLTATVRVQDRFFYVDGQIRNPNRFDYKGDITVLGAIAAAGGFTDFASPKKVQVTRANNQKVKVNCDKARDNPELDLPIYPGDRIIVPRRFW